MGTVSNAEYPDDPEVAVLHNGSVHDIKALVYDAKGFVGVWTTDDRWIFEHEIADIEKKFPQPDKYVWHEGDVTCEGSAQ